ncbi:hypothetical protein MMC24_001378 [Lignoscripta atroalba]|nr:hypothetical protein [Lignoscripta atroalba]
MFLTLVKSLRRHFKVKPNNIPKVEPRSIKDLLTQRNTTYERSRNLSWERGSKGDRPIDSLYRLYENIVQDWTMELRNEIEYFWNQHQWEVSAIPDPRDPDPARYAILSVIPQLLVRAFNRNIALGLPRDAPAIILDMEALKEKPKVLEIAPAWCKCVPPLEKTLRLPNEQGEFLLGKEDDQACLEFLEKNILVLQPHILFV